MKWERCPVCDGDSGEIFLQRRGVPGTQNLLARTREEARQIASAELAMAVCVQCGFVWNTAFDPHRVRYDQDYENSQTSSPAFERYVQQLVHHLTETRGICHHRIVEVGCGNGSFLKRLVTAPGTHNYGVGYDPCYRGQQFTQDGRLEFRQEFLKGEPLCEPCDVVISRHVIEHVPDPVSFLSAIRGSLESSSAARVYLETPCVEWILRLQSYWDLFHEHCSLFSSASLRTACERAGLQVTHVEHVFEEQYLWLEASLADRGSTEQDAGEIPTLARRFTRSERSWTDHWQRRLHELSATGSVAVWGAGAKGVTFANLLDPDATLIQCLVDLNPLKQGGFVPGSGHSIVAPKRLAAEAISSVLLMNSNYRAEVAALMAELRLDVPLIDVNSSDAELVSEITPIEKNVR